MTRRRRRSVSADPVARRRLRLEPLESRRLLASFTVDTLLDENDGNFSAGDFSLREAIGQANLTTEADDVDFASGLAGTITLGGTELLISQEINIHGPGAKTITVSGNDASRVFHVAANKTATISGLTITGGAVTGAGNNGGGILADMLSTVTLDGLFIQGNSSGNVGGGVHVDDCRFTIRNSTLFNNRAQNGGGMSLDGLLPPNPSAPTVFVINTTISGNQANFSGGGVYVDTGATEFRNSTIVNNQATFPVVGFGGGIYSSEDPDGTTTLHNTIVAGNLNSMNGPSDVTGRNVESNSSNNLIGHSGSSGGITNGTNGNIVGNTLINLPRVLETTLQDNGGPVPTHALVSGSLALDAGNNTFAVDAGGAALATDQRGTGFARVVDSADADAVATVDIGAYEAQPRTLVVDFLVDESDGDFSAGDFTLREAIERANANAGLDTIRFAPGADGNIDVGSAELSIRDSVSIEGPGANLIFVDGENQSRVFNIGTDANLNPVSVTISGLTIMHGSVFEASGGGINAPLLGTELTLRGVLLTRNEADDGSGGAVLVAAGKLTIIDSTIHDNAANNGAGVFYGGSGGLTVVNSTFTQNRAMNDGAGAYVFSGNALFRNSTFTQNLAESGGDGAGTGGGLFTTGGFAFTTLFNTLVAGNLSDNSSTASDIAGTLEAASSHNLIGDAATAGGLSHGVNGNIVGNAGTGALDVNTVLDPNLVNNGGSMPTHRLVANSPALDAGDNALALDASGDPLSSDQRGLPRISNADGSGAATVDIGAVELQAPIVANLGGTVTYVENAPPGPILTPAAITDLDSSDFGKGRLTVRLAVNAEAGDRLFIRNVGNVTTDENNKVRFAGRIIGTFGGGLAGQALFVNFNNGATPNKVQGVLRAVAYVHDGENPSARTRIVSVRLTDGDGGRSFPAAKQIRVVPVNDAPTLEPAEGTTVGYVRGAPPLGLLTSAVVADADANLAGGKLVVRATEGHHASNRLLIGGSVFTLEGDNILRNGVLIGTRNPGGGEGFTRLEIALTENATSGIVQQLVRAIRFRTIGTSPTTQRVIEFSLFDGENGASNQVDVTVNVS